MRNKILKSTMITLTTLTLSASTLFVLPIAASEKESSFIKEDYSKGNITIEAPDIINNVEEFDVSGTASYTDGDIPANHHIFLEIVNKDLDKPYIYEIQMVTSAVNGEYRFSSIRIPSGYADDTYLIRTYLWDDDADVLIAMNEKEVLLINQ